MDDNTTFLVEGTRPLDNAACPNGPCSGPIPVFMCDITDDAEDIVFIEITEVIGFGLEEGEGAYSVEDECSYPFDRVNQEVKARVVYSVADKEYSDEISFYGEGYNRFGKDVAVGDVFLTSFLSHNDFNISLIAGKVTATGDLEDSVRKTDSHLIFEIPNKAGELRNEYQRIRSAPFEDVCNDKPYRDKDVFIRAYFKQACFEQ